MDRHQHDRRLSSFWTAHKYDALSHIAMTKQASGLEDNEYIKALVVDDPTNIPILLETDRFLVIDKPAGIPHHNDDDENLGIVNLVRQQLERDRGDSAPRLYGVHRLDRVTSGILLFAKDSETAGLIQRAFQSGQVAKYYTGLSHSKATIKKQGWVQGNMVRGRRKSWYLTRGRDVTSIDNFAKTRFFTAGLGHLSTTAPKTLVLFRPCTGKTHQLRVAAKSVGLPLAGDPVYGSAAATDSDRLSTRTYLHATALYIPASALRTGAEDDESDLDGLTLWCRPPFNEAWRNDEIAQTSFNRILDKLIHKHCEHPELVELFDVEDDSSEAIQ